MTIKWNPRMWGLTAQDYTGMNPDDKRMRISDDQVREMRRLYEQEQPSFVAIAKLFSCSPRQASNIAQRQSRADVPDYEEHRKTA